MKLAIGLTCLLTLVCAPLAQADCKKATAAPATIDLTDCTSSSAFGQGLLLRGFVTWKKGGAAEDLRLWMDSSEMVDCSKLAEPSVFTANVEKLCCEPREGAACQAAANASVSGVKLASPTPAKKASRAQVDAEVERLRTANAQLRKDLFRLRAQMDAEIEQLKAQQAQLSHKMK